MINVNLHKYFFADIVAETITNLEIEQEIISDIIEDYISNIDKTFSIKEFREDIDKKITYYYCAQPIVELLEQNCIDLATVGKFLDNNFNAEKYTTKEKLRDAIEGLLDNYDYTQKHLNDLNKYLDNNLDIHFKIVYGKSFRLCAYSLKKGV